MGSGFTVVDVLVGFVGGVSGAVLALLVVHWLETRR